MNQSHKLLTSVFEAASMGKESAEMLMSKTEDEKMRCELHHLCAQYEQSLGEAEARLRETGGKTKSPNPMAKAGAWMGIQMDTLADRSNSHLADMLIQGTTMGIIDITRARSANPDADPEARRIANHFLKNEQDSIETLKTYL